MSNKNSQSGKKAANPDLDPFDELLQQFGTGHMVKVYRYDPKTTRRVFVTDMDSSDLDLMTVQEAFGGGRFQFRFYRDGEYKKAVTQDIAGPHRDLGLVTQEETAGERDKRLRSESVELTERLAGMGLEQRVETALAEMRAIVLDMKAAPPGPDPMTMALGLIRTMGELRPHVATPAPATSPAEILDIMKVGLELGRGQNSDSGAEGYERVLERFAPPILNLLTKAAGETPDPAAAQAAHNPPPDEAVPIDLRTALIPWVPHLVQWAEQGKDPHTRAAFILDELPTRWVDAFDDFLVREGGGAVTILLEWYPALLPHHGWTSELLEELRPEPEAEELEAAPAEPATEPEPEPAPAVEVGGPGTE